MAKIKTIVNIDLRANNQVLQIPKGSYIEVSEEMAVYWCNEDINQLSIDEQKKNTRSKKANRTNEENLSKTHIDYTFI